MRELIYHNNRSQAVAIIVAGLLIAFALTLGLFLGVRHDGFKGNIDFALAGIGVLILFGTLFVVWSAFCRLADGTAQLIVNECGIAGPRCRKGAYSWPAVRSIHLRVERSRGWVSFACLEVRSMSGEMTQVDIIGLDASPEQIQTAIRDFGRKRMQKSEPTEAARFGRDLGTRT